MPETAPATARHILLVEDDPDAGPLLLRLLQRSGYDVTLATDLDHALRESSQNHFDLVISDLRLPDGSGIDLLRQIRARRQNVRGICLSGLGSDIDLQETKDAGFERHLVKPVDLAALRHAIEKPA
jgi:DNA-binding response OmpR family regulator